MGYTFSLKKICYKLKVLKLFHSTCICAVTIEVPPPSIVHTALSRITRLICRKCVACIRVYADVQGHKARLLNVRVAIAIVSTVKTNNFRLPPLSALCTPLGSACRFLLFFPKIKLSKSSPLNKTSILLALSFNFHQKKIWRFFNLRERIALEFHGQRFYFWD